MSASWGSSRGWALLTLRLADPSADPRPLLARLGIPSVTAWRAGEYVETLVVIPRFYDANLLVTVLRLHGAQVDQLGLRWLRESTALLLWGISLGATLAPPVLRWLADRLDAAGRSLLLPPPTAFPPPPDPEPNNDGPDPVA